MNMTEYYPNRIVRVEFNELMQFIHASPENTDVFHAPGHNRLPLYFQDTAPVKTHFLAFDKAKIIGVASIAEMLGSLDSEPELSMQQVTVDKDHRNKGIAKRLLHSMFTYAQERNIVFAPTNFTPDGNLYLAHTMPRMHHQEFPRLRIRWTGYKTPVIDGTHPYKLVPVRHSETHKPEFI